MPNKEYGKPSKMRREKLAAKEAAKAARKQPKPVPAEEPTSGTTPDAQPLQPKPVRKPRVKKAKPSGTGSDVPTPPASTTPGSTEVAPG